LQAKTSMKNERKNFLYWIGCTEFGFRSVLAARVRFLLSFAFLSFTLLSSCFILFGFCYLFLFGLLSCYGLCECIFLILGKFLIFFEREKNWNRIVRKWKFVGPFGSCDWQKSQWCLSIGVSTIITTPTLIWHLVITQLHKVWKGKKNIS